VGFTAVVPESCVQNVQQWFLVYGASHIYIVERTHPFQVAHERVRVPETISRAAEADGHPAGEQWTKLERMEHRIGYMTSQKKIYIYIYRRQVI
jgi:hypothetical protein